MAAGTRAVAADMRRTATEVDNLSNETQNELKRLEGLAQALRANWQSQRSGRSFDDTMMRWHQDAAVIKRTMDEIAALMRASADRYDRTEEENVNATTRAGAGGGANYNVGR